MAKIGRAALTLGGAYFFGPAGALIGGFLGDLLFPQPGVRGPRLNELNVQRSTVGAPIALVYGTAALAGNVIWSGGLQETEHEGQSGGKKGGGSAPSNFTYAVDFAVGICEGPITGVRRIWADADLIYDASDDATLEARLEGSGEGLVADLINQIRAMSAQLDFTLYLGTEDQLPDPTIESYEVAGTVPAYRGLAYIVFTQFQLAKFGNRIPNVRVEVTTSSTPTECGLYSAGNLYPWIEGTNDPRNDNNVHQYQFGATTYDSLTAAAAAAATATGRPVLPDVIWAWKATSGGLTNSVCDGIATGDRIDLFLKLNSLETAHTDCTIGGGSCPAYDLRWGVHTLVWVGGGTSTGFEFRYLSGEAPEDFFPTVPAGDWSNLDACSSPSGAMEHLADITIQVTRTLLPPDPCTFGTPLVDAPGYCVVNGQIVQGITWTQVSGTFKALQAYHDNGVTVTSYPVDPTLPSTDSSYNDSAYWMAAYAQAVANGDMASGLTYGVDYPEVQSFAFFSECDTLDTACVPMATIVADLCRRAGLRTDTSSQIDVSDLTTCVTGYVVGSTMSARDALGPLRMFGLWDCCESGSVLKFVERGHAIVATLTTDDLGVHENGSPAPSLIETSRLQEKDLPRRLRLHFANYEHDHEPDEQSWSRITTEATNELDIQLPISMTPDAAVQLAEIMLYAEWVGRNTYRTPLDNDFLFLEPTDCIEVPVDGQTERMRIVATNYSIGGIIQLECQRDDDGSYVSTAVSTPSQPSGGVPGSGGNGPICPSEVVLLDLPRLLSTHIDAGYYAAIYGLCDSWSCAELYRSSDGGLTYARVARTDIEATVGEITDISGPATDPVLPGESPAYDAFNTITVQLFNGELSSITDEQIAAGQNLAAVGLDGRWVIIQFKTATFATDNTWVLSDLIWGVNDTSHLLGTTVTGDTFVLLSDTALLRIPESPEAIGVEKQFKVITCGESLDDVTEFDFTTWGLSYQRLCPSTVISATTTTPPTSPADGDAYLLPNDTSLSGVWATHGGEIATWSDETDSWVYCTPAPGTIIHIGGDSSDPGDDVIAPGGGGTPTAAPWTPAIPPLIEDTGPDPDTSYLVVYTEDGYRKIPMADVGGGGGSVESVTGTEGVTVNNTDPDNPVALLDINGLTTVGSLATNDKVAVYDVSASAHRVATISQVISAATGVAMTHVGSSSVVGTAATTLTVSGLDLDAHGSYFILLSVKNATASASSLFMYYNADTTPSNYFRDIQSNGSGSQAGDAGIASMSASTSGQTLSFGVIRRVVSRVSASINTGLGANTSASMRGQVAAHMWTTTATNVTGITISASVANSLDIGSKLEVYRLSP